MKVVICGAGQVGQSIARYLSQQQNDVTIVDSSEEIINQVSNTLDVRGVCGFASHPDVLESADIANAEMIIAVTNQDEVNMVACQVAHSLFNVPMKISRVRDKSFLDPRWSGLYNPENMPINMIISPELEVARAIRKGLEVPGAFDVVSFGDGLLKLIGLRCKAKAPILHTPLRLLGGLFPDLEISVMCVVRGDEAEIPHGDSELLPGDEVYCLARSSEIASVIEAFGYKGEQSHRLLILGGGNVGLCLLQEIEDNLPHVKQMIIERDRDRAIHISNTLQRTTVLKGDCLDENVLEEAGIERADTVVAVTDDDKVNIMASLMAKRMGAKQVLALVNNSSYPPLVTSLGVDSVISPKSLTVSKILQYVRKGKIKAVHSLREGYGEIIEAEVISSSNVLGKTLGEISVKGEFIVGAVIRAGEVLAAKADLETRVGDHLVMILQPQSIGTVEKLFSVRLGYF